MHRSRRFVPAILLAAALALGACSEAGELGGPSIGGTNAAVIGDYELSSADLEAEVEAWAAQPEFLRQVLQIEDPGAPGRRSVELVTFVISHRVLSERGRQIMDQTGAEVVQADVETILQQLDANFLDINTGTPILQLYSDEFRQRLGEDFVRQTRLSEADLTTLTLPEVVVNPRYGTAEEQTFGFVQIVPPEGPRPAPLDLLGS